MRLGFSVFLESATVAPSSGRFFYFLAIRRARRVSVSGLVFPGRIARAFCWRS